METQTKWGDESKDTAVIIKKRNSRKNTVRGIIKTKEGETLAQEDRPTFSHITKSLRGTGIIPSKVAIKKNSTTYFNRTKT